MIFEKTKQYLVYRRKSETGNATIALPHESVSFSLDFFDAFEHDKPGVVLAISELRGFSLIAREPLMVSEWYQDYIAAKEIEQSRKSETESLDLWWDNYPGIEFAEGIKLPIEKASVGLNGVSVMTAMQQQSDASLLDVNDRSVTIPAANIAQAMGVFQTEYAKISAEYDRRADEIKAKHDQLLSEIY